MAPKFMTQYNQFQRTSYRYSKSRSLQKEVAEEKLFCFFPDRSAAKYAAKFLINLTHGIQWRKKIILYSNDFAENLVGFILHIY